MTTPEVFRRTPPRRVHRAWEIALVVTLVAAGLIAWLAPSSALPAVIPIGVAALLSAFMSALTTTRGRRQLLDVTDDDARAHPPGS